MSDSMDINKPATSRCKSIFVIAYGNCSNYLSDVGEKFAGYRVGQFIFRITDDALRAVEKSVQWSVQPQINPSPLEETGSADKKGNECLMTNGSRNKTYPGELVRPLPWVFFIPLLLLIRAVRKGDEIRALLFKREATSPKQVVRYIQGFRRRLRAIKYRSVRSMRAGVAKRSVDAAKSQPATLAAAGAVVKSPGSAEGSEQLSKRNKRKLSDLENGSSDEDEDADAGGPVGQENYLEQLLDGAQQSDSDNDPDFEPSSSLDASSSESEALCTDGSDDDAPQAVEVKRLSQPTSLINADIIEEEVEESVDSSTISISEVEDHGDDANDLQGMTGHVEETGSEYYTSCTVSLSAKSVDIASSSESKTALSDDSSTMQKMSNLFSIKGKKAGVKK